MTTDTHASPSNRATTEFSEWPAALHALRARYRESRDLFSPREMARLCFLRWLVQTGRLAL
jgi:hypothetical protein